MTRPLLPPCTPARARGVSNLSFSVFEFPDAVQVRVPLLGGLCAAMLLRPPSVPAHGSPPSSLHRLRIPFASLTDTLEIQAPGATHHCACRRVCTGYFTPYKCCTDHTVYLPAVFPCSTDPPVVSNGVCSFFINESMDAGAKADA